MIQCTQCEYFNRDELGLISCACDPFSTIKEPECLAKLQLIRLNDMNLKLDRMVRAYESTLATYRRLAPIQEKMFRHMEREIDEAEDADRWKHGYSDDDDEEDEPCSDSY